MPSSLYFPLFVLAVIIRLSFTEEILPELQLFQVGNSDPQGSITAPLASDLNNPELIAWNDPGVNTLDQQNTDVDVNLWKSPLNEDGSYTDLLLAVDGACSPTGQLGKRDGKGNSLLCPGNEFKAPTIPTLDNILDKIVPLGSSDDPQNSPPEPLLGDDLLWKDGEGRCPSDHPYFLCCICEAQFLLQLCQDCVLSV